MKKHILFSIMLLSATAVKAQTINDGLMMPRNNFCTGIMLGYDEWSSYWEGTLKRTNENIGNVTTKSIQYVGNYGITDKLNIIAMLPYVKTKATLGTMTGLEGLQDLTLALKYNFYKKTIGSGTLKTFGVVAFSTPVSDYSPDYLPLSIGMGSKNLSWRLTGNYTLTQGLYINVSGAYTWRSNVTLDRPSYYTEGELFLTDEVKMPNVFDFSASIGYIHRGVQTQLSYIQMNTLGGDDIRRQDMPFVSNRMNFGKAEALIMYYLPRPKYLAFRASASYTVAGRNVGQSTTLMAGLLYTFRFNKNTNI